MVLPAGEGQVAALDVVREVVHVKSTGEFDDERREPHNATVTVDAHQILEHLLRMSRRLQAKKYRESEPIK